MIKTGIMKASIFANAACMGIKGETCSKGTSLNEGENKMAFQNFYKQMKAPYAVYADFECIVKKIHTCEPDNKKSFTVKTEKQEPCRFSYVVVRSDGQTQGPYTYRGEDAVYVFLRYLQEHEKEMREDMANNRPLVMTNEDWQKYRNGQNVISAAKACTKISISTRWRSMILIQENTAAKATENATTRR